jgi:hypothetical protein
MKSLLKKFLHKRKEKKNFNSKNMKIYEMRAADVKGMPCTVEPKIFFEDFHNTKNFRKNFDRDPNYYIKYPIEFASSDDWGSDRYKLYDTISIPPAYALTVSQKVKDLFEKEKISDKLDFLPINVKNVKQQYYFMLFDRLPIIDCLDRKKSKLDYYSDNPNKNNPDEVMSIIQGVFKKEKIKKNDLIFRIPENDISAVFVQDKMIDLFKENDIHGFEFIWVEDPEYELICLNGMLMFPKGYDGSDGRYIILK